MIKAQLFSKRTLLFKSSLEGIHTTSTPIGQVINHPSNSSHLRAGNIVCKNRKVKYSRVTQIENSTRALKLLRNIISVSIHNER